MRIIEVGLKLSKQSCWIYCRMQSRTPEEMSRRLPLAMPTMRKTQMMMKIPMTAKVTMMIRSSQQIPSGRQTREAEWAECHRSNRVYLRSALLHNNYSRMPRTEEYIEQHHRGLVAEPHPFLGALQAPGLIYQDQLGIV